MELIETVHFPECEAKCCGSQCDPKPPSSALPYYIGGGAGGTAGLIIVIIIVVVIVRIRRCKPDETYLDPTHEPNFLKENEDYSRATNYYLTQISVASDESLGTNAS